MIFQLLPFALPIYSLVVINSRQVMPRETWLALTVNLVCYATEPYRPSLSYYTGTSRTCSAPCDHPLTKDASINEETSSVNDSFRYLRASILLNSRAMLCWCSRLQFFFQSPTFYILLQIILRNRALFIQNHFWMNI